MKAKDTQRSSFSDNWPSLLNRGLVVVCVLAVGFVVADKALDMYQSNENAQLASATGSTDEPSADKQLQLLDIEPVVTIKQVSEEQLADIQQAKEKLSTFDIENVVVRSSNDDVDAEAEPAEVLAKLESVFGSAVVIVSATKPAYVVTADESRFIVGSTLQGDQVLSEISTAKLIISDAGKSTVYELPDSSAQ